MNVGGFNLASSYKEQIVAVSSIPIRFNKTMKYKAIIETGVIDKPRDHELKAALIVETSALNRTCSFSVRVHIRAPTCRYKVIPGKLRASLGTAKRL